MNNIDRAIGITETATRSDNDWLRKLAERNLLELVGNRAKAMREGREFARSPKPPVEPERRTKLAVDAAMCVAVAALVAALIYAWPEPRHSYTLTVSDGWVER